MLISTWSILLVKIIDSDVALYHFSSTIPDNNIMHNGIKRYLILAEPKETLN